MRRMSLAQLQSFVLVARHGSVKGGGGARGDRAGRLRRGRGAAQGPRRRALRPRRPRHRAHARRPPARRAGRRGPRRRRAGAALGTRVGGRVAAHASRRDEPRSPTTSRRSSTRSPPATTASRSRSRRWRARRSATCSSIAAPMSRSGRIPDPTGWRGSRRRRSCAAASSSPPRPATRSPARTTSSRALAGERWLVGQPELDPTTGTGLFLARTGIAPRAVAPYSSQAAANAAAAAGEGIVLTLAHSVVEDVRRRALVRLDVRGTPFVELWHASTLGVGRALPAALALQRFATTSEATQALSTGRAGAVSTRARPKVHVTLWRSVADGIDAAAGR